MEIKERTFNFAEEEILEKRFRKRVKGGSMPHVIFSREELHQVLEPTINFLLLEVGRVIDDGIKDMEFMIKQGKYKSQAITGLSVLRKLKEALGIK